MKTLNLLVVDDETGMRCGVQKVLSRFHFNPPEYESEISFNICVAENGRNALVQIDNNPFDIVLLDYKLPDMQGLDILKKICSTNNNQPLVFIKKS